jgi:Glycosyltransferase family 87
MGTRVRRNAVAVIGAASGLALLAWLGLVGFAWSDYDSEVAPAYKALVDGHVLPFLHLMPAYGGSLILRAPFALLPGLWGGGELAVYRSVAVPCLLAAGVLGVWLVARMRVLGVGTLARATALGLCVASPIALRALEIGHPEDLLGAALCVAAVLTALAGRATWGGVLLGLAIANKQWALVAVAPLLVALPGQRLRALTVAAATAAAILAPSLIAAPGHFATTNQAASSTGTIFQPWQAWWFTGSFGHVIRGGDGLVKLGYRYPPAWIGSITHPLIVAISVPLSLLWVRLRRATSSREDVLLLLALVLLLRCVLDPFNNIYYSLPFLMALLSWETLRARRVPVVTLGSTAVLWLIFQKLPGQVTPDVQSLAYVAWALPLGLWLAVTLYAPERASRYGRAATRRQPRFPAGALGSALGDSTTG